MIFRKWRKESVKQRLTGKKDCSPCLLTWVRLESKLLTEKSTIKHSGAPNALFGWTERWTFRNKMYQNFSIKRECKWSWDDLKMSRMIEAFRSTKFLSKFAFDLSFDFLFGLSFGSSMKCLHSTSHLTMQCLVNAFKQVVGAPSKRPNGKWLVHRRI